MAGTDWFEFPGPTVETHPTSVTGMFMGHETPGSAGAPTEERHKWVS